MSPPHSSSVCNRTCQDFVNHARHECCVICNPPSPAPTVSQCPECRSPVDLAHELAKLTAAVVELQDLVADLRCELLAEDVSDGE